MEISARPVGRNGYKTSSLHSGLGGAGRSLSRRRRSYDDGRWVSRPAARRLSRGLGVAFSCAGGGWHGTPTSLPTGQSGRRRSAPRSPCAGRRPWAVRGVVRVWVRDASLMVGRLGWLHAPASWAGFARADSRSCRPGAARDAAAPGLSCKMSRSEACAAPLASPLTVPAPAPGYTLHGRLVHAFLSCELVDDRVFQSWRNSRRCRRERETLVCIRKTATRHKQGVA